MLPEGWKYSNLGEFASNITSGSRDWAQYYSDTGDKFVRMTNLARDGVKISENDMKFVSIPHDSTDGKRTALKNGDILISITAELGKIGLVPNGFGTAFINQHLALVRLKTATASSTFVAYALSSKKLNQKMNSLNDAGAKAGLNLSTIRSFPILLPPLPEQKKIAAILSTWDRAIEGAEKLLANSQQQKKALMQQLLTGKKRLPGFTGEWKVNRLGEIYSSFTGLSGKTKNDFGSGYKYITYKNVFLNSCVNIKDIEYVEIKTNENQNKLQYGDILFTTSSETPEEVGMSSVFLYGGNDIFYLNSFCFGFRPKKSLVMNPNFSQFLFRGEEIRRKIQLLAQGATRYNISKNKLSEISLNLPPLPEQKAIAAVLSTSDEEITALESDLARLRQEKKALMQQLLTGKRRVTVD
ncbi:restriction endonuclease subunit S [Acetobacter sp. P5B1]|uniref:restriction endonuclease subunit S n=1 Tax=Acetobacter sp. P5B1 TaxID=2762620 RepID=UPI001C05D8DF|nr:restriction endonuclease subunit S [Acetobacter sp. P5B1]